ncbi:MAG: hypothetical protein IKX36_09520 [Prevotella sp.]|nr:hypothetical protein [Prevotella sp.]
MNAPNILYYAKMVNTTQRGRKTPRYTIVAQAGYYSPMEHLRGRDGKISMYLTEKLKEGERVPAMRLQAKNSLNFTGLKEFFVDGKLSGFAYGYPLDRPTYSNDNKPNPFYTCKDDGFLFIIHGDGQDPNNVIPTCIEMIILPHAKPIISGYCKQLQMGGFNKTLELIRGQATGENDM